MKRYQRMLILMTATFVVINVAKHYHGKANEDGLIVEQATYQSFCRFGSAGLSFSPDGKFIVFDQAIERRGAIAPGGRRLNVTPISCLLQKNSLTDCSITLQSQSLLRVISWSEADRSMFVIDGSDYLTEIDFGQEASAETQLIKISAKRKIPPGLSKSMMFYGSSLSRNVQEESEALQGYYDDAIARMSKDSRLKGVYIFGERGAIAAYQDEGTHSITVQNSKGSVGLNLVGTELPALQVLPDGNGFLAVDQGVRVDSENGLTANESSVAAFSKPIVNAHGKLMGFIDPIDRGIAPEGRLAAELAPKLLKEVSLSAENQLEDVAIASADQYGEIYSSVNGTRHIKISVGNRVFEQSCDMPPMDPFVSKPVTIHSASLGNESRPLYGVHLKQKDPQGMVLFLSGGPTNDSDFDESFTVRKYLSLGWDVLAVKYSGNVGAGVATSRRLREMGLQAAFSSDADAIARSLNTVPSDRKLVVHGESFGGLLALTISAKLERSHRNIIVTPWIKYRNPREWLNDSPSYAQISYQKAFERSIFGQAYWPTLDDSIRSLLPKTLTATSTVLVFGDLDGISKVDDIPVSWDPSEYKVLGVKGTHAFVASDRRVWTEIKLALEASDKKN